MIPRKFDSFLNVTRGSSVDANYRHAPLLTREAERGVEVAALDCPIGKGVRFSVGVFGGTRLIGTPDTVEPTSLNLSTVSCGGVVAWGGWWDRVDQWLRDF
jgi:hypothetical protein